MVIQYLGFNLMSKKHFLQNILLKVTIMFDNCVAQSYIFSAPKFIECF